MIPGLLSCFCRRYLRRGTWPCCVITKAYKLHLIYSSACERNLSICQSIMILFLSITSITSRETGPPYRDTCIYHGVSGRLSNDIKEKKNTCTHECYGIFACVCTLVNFLNCLAASFFLYVVCACVFACASTCHNSKGTQQTGSWAWVQWRLPKPSLNRQNQEHPVSITQNPPLSQRSLSHYSHLIRLPGSQLH